MRGPLASSDPTGRVNEFHVDALLAMTSSHSPLPELSGLNPHEDNNGGSGLKKGGWEVDPPTKPEYSRFFGSSYHRAPLKSPGASGTLIVLEMNAVEFVQSLERSI